MNASAATGPVALPPFRRRTLWIIAIREGFILLLPLTLLGGAALALAELLPLLGRDLATVAGISLEHLCRRTVAATLGIVGLAAAVTISMRACSLLAERLGLHAPPPPAGIAAIAGAAFAWGALGGDADLSQLGYGNIVLGIFCGLASAEIGCAIYGRRRGAAGLAGLLQRSLPWQALRLIWVALALLGAVAVLNALVAHGAAPAGRWLWGHLSVGIAALQLGPVVLNALMTVVNQLAWLVGINGGQVLLQISGQGVLLVPDKLTLWSDHVASPMFMNAFAHLGGAGATWGLIVAILCRSRDAGMRRLSQLSIAPAVLNVNEPLLLGLPLVFSPIMWVPFVLAPVANVVIAASLFSAGVLQADGQPVVWSTPVLLSGVTMTHDEAGAWLQLALIALDAAIYLPFLRRLERVRLARSDHAFHQALDVLLAPPDPAAPRVLARADDVGDVARRLMEDFSADLLADRVELLYQPKHARDGSVVGVEALTRWHHPHHGPIPIVAVVNAAEDCEVIHDLGRWVVMRACRDMAALHQDGFAHLHVGINMSPRQLESTTWPDDVASALYTHGLQPQALDVEITEGRALTATPQSDATLRRLQALGVGLSMDDFGMGCTSLLYMQRFRMHSIKLDGALTRDVLTNSVNQDIVAAVARLGHAQGVKIVAEFVETAEQRDLLGVLGCDVYQGWLYSKALALDDLRTYLDRDINRPPDDPVR